MTTATAHAEFVAQRRAYIGGTDISAIIGVSPWATPLSVYLDKTAPEQAELKDSLPMRRGLALEKFIADEFMRETGLICWHPAPIVRTDWGFPAGASLDYLVAYPEHPRTPIGLMDAKAAMSFYGRQQWKAPDPHRGYEEGDLPDAYYTQLAWYLAVTELPRAWGVADTGDDSLIKVPVKPNAKVQEKLIDAGLRFWTEHVLAGIPPEPSGTDTDHDALQRMWPETVPEPPVYIEDDVAEGVLSDYLAHKLKAKEHGAQADLAQQRLESLMGEHEHAVVGGWHLSWKPITSNRIDSKRLKAELPEVAAQYSKPSTSRRFEVKEGS